MKNSKPWIIILSIISVVLAILLFSTLFKSNYSFDQSATQIKNVNTTSELQSQYAQTLGRLDELTTYVNSIQSAKFQDVTPIDLPEISPKGSCEFSNSRLLGTLNSGSDKFFYLIDRSKKITASLLGLKELNLGKNEKLGIMDYIEYKDTTCINSGVTSKVKLAAGARLELSIKESKNKISFSTPSQIAAAMELNLAKVTYRIRTIGFKTDSTRKILSGIEEQGDFNVKSYVRVIDALNKIMLSMNDSLQVNPEVVPY